MPLRGTSRLTLDTSGPLVGSPRAARAARRSAAGRGAMVAVSTPGGISTTGARSPGAARRASVAGYEPADTTMLASRKTRRQRGSCAGQPGGHRDLGPVEDDAVGQIEPGPEQPEREGGIEQDEVDPVVTRAGAHGGQRRRRREVQDGAGHPFDVDAAL